MMLHWFSPLEPARTAIAHYTTHVLPELASAAEVTLWTDQKQWDPALEKHAAIHRFDPNHPNSADWELLNHGQAAFYNLGNNGRFHSAIWKMSRRHPGIVILHDLRLHDFCGHLYREVLKDRRGYLDMMETAYGDSGRKDAALYWDSVIGARQMTEQYPCLSVALDTALGAVVHSSEGGDLARREKVLPLLYSPLPYAAASLPPSVRDPSETPLRLVLFGYLGPNRCVDALLTALAGLGSRDRFHLDIYGEVDDASALATRIRALGIRPLVTVHGFVPEPELDAALARAHFAINLRYPTMGEASYSQLRIWSHGLASVVTKVGWYAGLPEDTVAFVQPESTVEDLQRRLSALAADPAPFFAMGAKGYELLVSDHHPRQYARSLIAFAADAAEQSARLNAFTLADRVGESLRGLMPLDALRECSADAARGILELTGDDR